MRKTFLILLAVFCVFLCACEPAAQTTEPKPNNDAEKAAVKLLEAIKSFDCELVEEMLIFAESEQEFFLGLDDEQFDIYGYVSEDTQNLNLYMRFAAQKLSYIITSSELSENSATVNAYVNYADSSDVIASAYGALNNAFLAAGLNNTEYPDSREFIDGELLTAIHNNSPAMEEKVLTLELVKTDGEWRIRSSKDIYSLVNSCLFDDLTAIKNAMTEVGKEII